jgi:hypothetical protein
MTASEKAGGTAQSGHGILERIKHMKSKWLSPCASLCLSVLERFHVVAKLSGHLVGARKRKRHQE